MLLRKEGVKMGCVERNVGICVTSKYSRILTADVEECFQKLIGSNEQDGWSNSYIGVRGIASHRMGQ